MALIDFYKLALLYRLSRRDAGILPDPTHPPPMPAPTPSGSCFLPNDLNDTSPLTFLSTRSVISGCQADATGLVRGQTPLACGTSVVQKLRLDTDQPQKYSSDKYEQYIVQDFERHRVFVDIDVFMENVLHVPNDWRETWGDAIARIKVNGPFHNALIEYTHLCDTSGTPERDFYSPLVDMTNQILNLSRSQESVKPQTPQRYLVNDPKRLSCGVINDLSPDIVAVHGDFLPYVDVEEDPLKKPRMTWAHPLQVLEVKPWDNALVDGSCMPRLKVNGKRAKTSGDALLKLIEDRTRSTEEPCACLHAVAIHEEASR